MKTTNIPYVIGMKGDIPPETAIELAKAFYKGIARGIEIFPAYSASISILKVKNMPGADIPFLL